MYSIKQAEEPALDAGWYRQLLEITNAIGETFEVLMPPLDRLAGEYEEFKKSGRTGTPSLYPAVQDTNKFAHAADDLQDLKNRMEKNESSPQITLAYSRRIDELIANCKMILGAARQDDAAFKTANTFIYGTPDREVFAASCTWVRAEAERVRQASPHMSDICEAVLQKVPAVRGNAALLFPDDATFKAVKALHQAPKGYFEQLFDDVKFSEGARITPAEGDAITRRAIANVGSNFSLENSLSGLWSVLQSRQKVIRPSDYTLSPEAFMGIVAHEVGSHLLESTNGGKSRLRLLELGLERYELGNEGRAFMREQIMYESFDDYIHQADWSPMKASWEYRIAIHMVISLASGLGGRNYTFSELYELVAALYRFWTASRGLEIDEEIINQGAWNLTVRALKGTSGHGGAYLKDIVYLEGNIRCWREAGRDPRVILYGDNGKFDIANPSHVMMLKELGILLEK
jgi:hypothetical protein